MGLVRRKTLFRVVFLILTLLVCIVSMYHVEEETISKRVLLIQSYDDDYPTNRVFENYIRKAFKSNNVDVDFKTIYLDCESYNNEEELVHMNELLCELQNQSWNPNLIFVNDDQACFSFLSCGHPWANDKPVVFGGVNFPNANLLSQHPNATGFHDEIDLGANFKLIDEFQRKKSPYFYTMIFLDSTYLEKKTRKMLHAYVAEHSDKVDYMDRNTIVSETDEIFELSKTYSASYQEFLRHVMNTKEKMSVFSSRVRGGSGSNLMWACSVHEGLPGYYLKLTSNRSTEIAEDFCQMPKFTAINERFGVEKGYVAGYFISFRILADEMVGVAMQIFRGKSPQDIPMQKSKKEYVADWQAMQRFHIDPNNFDSRFRLVNVPFYVRYNWLMMLLVIVVLGANTVALIYLHNRRNKERALKETAESELAKTNKVLADSLSKLKEQYEELLRVRMIVEKAELKQSFLDSMTHEIRTPLNAIVGFASLLTDDNVFDNLSKEERHEFMSLIHKNTDSLLKIVNDIIEISRIESGDVVMEMGTYKAQEILKELYNSCAYVVTNNKFSLETDNADVEINIDPNRFALVITNLLHNANKFTHEGEIVLGSTYLKEENVVRFYVHDNGVGLDKEQQVLVFNRFYKVDPFVPGTGLGLSISLAIMEKMNSDLKVTSEVGKGSTFYMDIPVEEI